MRKINLSIDDTLYTHIKYLSNVERKTVTKQINSLLEYALVNHEVLLNIPKIDIGSKTYVTFHNGLLEVFNIINTPSKNWNSECVVASELFKKVDELHPTLKLKNAQKFDILTELGYFSLGKTIKLSGNVCRVWIKNKMTNAEIRESLGCILK